MLPTSLHPWQPCPHLNGLILTWGCETGHWRDMVARHLTSVLIYLFSRWTTLSLNPHWLGWETTRLSYPLINSNPLAKKVEEDIRLAETLGILEKVSYSVPVTRYHLMVVTQKDGFPRRTGERRQATDTTAVSVPSLQTSRGKSDVWTTQAILMRIWRLTGRERSTFWQKSESRVSCWTAKHSSSLRKPSILPGSVCHPIALSHSPDI